MGHDHAAAGPEPAVVAAPDVAAPGPAVGGGAASVVALQRSAGNAAVARALGGAGGTVPRGLMREPTAPPAPGPAVAAQGSVKHTVTVPDKKLGGEKDLSYASAQFKLGGVLDVEVTPPQATAPNPTSGVTLKGAGGVNATEGGGKYQAEVTAEFEKRVGGILDGCTPKAKVGGEAGGGEAKLGLEFSLEGERFEPKFGITIFDITKEDGIKFATLELGVDWKIKEWSFKAADGADIKITPKATLKVEITPNYKRIATQLAEGGAEGAASIAVEAALVAGPPLLVGVLIAQGIYMAGEKGELHRQILEGAVGARQAAMSYAQVMTGNDQEATGPRAKEAVAKAKGQLAGIAAANKVPVETLMAELRKNPTSDFVRIHEQTRRQVFSTYYDEINKVIRAWRSEHYILAIWTEHAEDVREASKQVEVVFSH